MKQELSMPRYYPAIRISDLVQSLRLEEWGITLMTSGVYIGFSVLLAYWYWQGVEKDQNLKP